MKVRKDMKMIRAGLFRSLSDCRLRAGSSQIDSLRFLLSFSFRQLVALHGALLYVDNGAMFLGGISELLRYVY